MERNESDALIHNTHKPFIGFWQPRKAGLNKHTGNHAYTKYTIYTIQYTQNHITGNDLVQIE